MALSIDDLKKYLSSPKDALTFQATGGGNALLDEAEHNKTAQDFAKKLGFGKTDAEKQAEADLAASKAAYEGLTPPDLVQEHPQYASAYDVGPSELGNVSANQADRAAQMEQLGALQNLARNGGRNAASDYNLAQIQQQERAAAKGQRDAILQNANARGVGGSGASLLAQLTGAQNEQNNQSLQDMNVRAQEQNQALQAGQGAANLGAQMENTDYQQQANKAAANDAIARFNAGQRTGVSQANAGIGNQAQQFNSGLQQTGYQNQFQKTAGLSGSNLQGVNYNQAQAAQQAQMAGNIAGGLFGVGSAAASKAGAAAPAAAAAAAHGGRIPGLAPVAGDSPRNDVIPTMTSPGEVVVPRSVAQSGNALSISNFVKHPPQVKVPQGAQDKEAMLSALANIRRRR